MTTPDDDWQIQTMRNCDDDWQIQTMRNCDDDRQIQTMPDPYEPMLIKVPDVGNPCAEIEMDPLGPGELRPISPTPDTSNAWEDFVVPMLRWMGAGTADDAALIVLSLGRHR